MKIIAIINQKGGVGKTTTTANLGAGLTRLGKSVLLLDLDPQANLSLHLDQRPDLETDSMTQLLIEDVPLADLIRETNVPGMSIVPADTSLGGVEQVLANRIGRETILREAFATLPRGRFDYVLIDCPPSLGVLSANALVAAHEVLIPMQTEYFSLQGMAKLTEVIQLVQRRLNPSLAILCVLPCMVDLRTRLTEEVLREIGAHFGGLVARSFIRNNVKLAEAPSFGRTIFDHAPDSNGARDYQALTLEVLERHGVVPERDAIERAFARGAEAIADATLQRAEPTDFADSTAAPPANDAPGTAGGATDPGVAADRPRAADDGADPGPAADQDRLGEVVDGSGTPVVVAARPPVGPAPRKAPPPDAAGRELGSGASE